MKARARAEYSAPGRSGKADVATIASTAAGATEREAVIDERTRDLILTERVKQLRTELRDIDAARSDLPLRGRNAETGAWEVGGESYASMSDALLALNALEEQKTIEAGATVALLAEFRSGIAPDTMQNYWRSENEHLKAVLDADQKESLTPEQQVEMDAALAVIAGHSAELAAFEAAHVNDYPDPDYSSFYPRLRAHLRDNPKDEAAKALDAEYDELLTKHQRAQVARRRLEQAQRAHLDEARTRYNALNSEYGRTETQLAEMMRKRADGYLAVLGELREFGGAELKVSADSHKKSVKVLQSALRYYPKEWIEASNAATEKRELRIKHTDARAHYSDGAVQKKSSRMPSVRAYIEDADWKPDPNYVHDHGAIVVQANEQGEAVYELPNGYKHTAHLRPGQVMIVRPEWEVWHSYGGPRETAPPGRGWQSIKTKHTHWQTGVETEELTWLRQKSRTYATSREVKAEITISGSKTGFQDEDGFTVALHEFAHRVESTSSERISRIEAAFLERRRKASAGDGKKDALTRIYQRGKAEIGYEDEFTSRYMGKIYSGQRYKELLSTGMEALFGGSYGGLAGTGGMRRDDDMQHLILGLLATA